jgi:hypothetical protein
MRIDMEALVTEKNDMNILYQEKERLTQLCNSLMLRNRRNSSEKAVQIDDDKVEQEQKEPHYSKQSERMTASQIAAQRKLKTKLSVKVPNWNALKPQLLSL